MRFAYSANVNNNAGTHTHTKRQSKNTKAFKNNSIPYAPVCANFVCLFASFFSPYFSTIFSLHFVKWLYGDGLVCKSAPLRFILASLEKYMAFFLKKEEKKQHEK